MIIIFLCYKIISLAEFTLTKRKYGKLFYRSYSLNFWCDFYPFYKKSIFKTNVFNNSKLVLAIVASTALMLVILLVPFLRNIFSIPVLPTENILELIVLIFAPIVIVEIFKLFKINTTKEERD